MDFNFRFATTSMPDSLKAGVESVLQNHGRDYDITWTLGGEPFLTPEGALSRAVIGAIHEETGTTARLSTTGGTSDGRYLAKICRQVIESGPVHATIPHIHETIPIASPAPLNNLYRRTLATLLLYEPTSACLRTKGPTQ